MFWVVLDRDPLKKCSVIAVAPQSSIFCPIICQLYSSSSISDDVICNIVIYFISLLRV